MPQTGDKLCRLTAAEVAEMLHLHVNTVKRLGDRGELPFYRVCKRGDRRFRLDDVMKFLAQNPGKVFTRETLLSRVWGYEYYGGARTVDVHVRRLRAKLGEEHANLIQTVRSVGYKLGQSRWKE